MRKRYRRTFLVDSTIITLGIVMALAGIAGLLNTPQLLVAHISVLGRVNASEEAITMAARDALTGSYFGLIPRSTIVAVPNNRVATAVLAHVPRVESVEVSRKGFRGIEVSVTERQPVSLWCGDVVPNIGELKTATDAGSIPGESCYLVDATGVIFAESPGMSEGLYPRFWGALEGARPLGARFASLEAYGHLMEFVDHLNAANIKSLGILLVDEEEGELYLRDGTKVLFLHSGDLLKTAQSLEASISSGVIPAGENVLEYIDMRFPDRAYFKRQSTAPEEDSVAIPAGETTAVDE